MVERRTLTQAELYAEAEQRFGADPNTWAFQCPHCDDIATAADFIAAGASGHMIGQECIGRHVGALDAMLKPGNYTGRGCNWVAYGIIPGPWQVVMPPRDGLPERPVWSFPLAYAAAAVPS